MSNKSSQTKYDSFTIDRLAKGWVCVLSQYQQECADNSIEHDGGITLFKFLPSSNSTSDVNCERAFIPKDSYIFNSLLENEPSSAELMKIYDPRVMYIIAVQVPITNSPHSTIGTVRVFNYGENGENDESKEVHFQAVKKD